MKVGDLVKVMTKRFLHLPVVLTSNGQLAIIIEHNEAVCNPWKVMIMTGEESWFKPNELELL